MIAAVELPPPPDRRLNSLAIVPWMAVGAATSIAAFLAAGALSGGLGDDVGWLSPLVWAAAVVYALVATLVAPVLRLRTWRYAVREEELDLLNGAFVRRRTIVPMARVQHVDTRQDALARVLGLATLNVHTAAARHEIPGLAARDAFALRTAIAQRARVPDDV
jgi:hypothetical protein